MNSKGFKYLFYVLPVLLAIVSYVSIVNAGTWTAPTATPPNNNVDAPLNVGPVRQVKLGSLTVNSATVNPDTYGLDVFGISRFFGNIEVGSILKPSTIKIIDGNQSDGKVLVSDANGVASWKTIDSIQNNTTNNNANLTGAGVYTFTSDYYTLMRNTEFRTWFSSFTNGTAMLKPLSGQSSESRDDEGWAKWNAQSTADKLCNFFTNGPSIKYQIREGASDWNNNFYYWDSNTNSWLINWSDWIDSTDIYEVSCLALDGVKRGSILLKNDVIPGTKCTNQRYATTRNCPN